MTEDELSRTFATKSRNSSEFVRWILSRTKFSIRQDAALLWPEQAKRRPKNADNWWKDWWYPVPGLSVQGRQTDVFLCFEDEWGRFALNIENKKRNGKFEDGQAEDYGRVALVMMEREKEKMRYSDFQTVLIAPRAFRQALCNVHRCDLFGAFVSYEEIAVYIPEFASYV